MIDATDPNALQRVAANPFESAWVAASAGSGKTKVLSDRVLNLLLTGTPPEKILCLTFTRTAAAQMANKISERLGKWAAEDESDLIKDLTDLRNAPPDAPLIARARRLFARLLDTAGGLKITTLHGFCQSLLKRFPLEAGISPHFDVTDESGAKDLIARAQTDVLRDSAYADCLKTITLMTDEDGFLKLLAEMTFHMSKLRRINERFKTPEALKAAYESALSLPSNATKESLTRDFCRLSEERKAALKTAVAILSESTKSTDTKNGAVIADFLTADETDRLERLDKYIDAFVTQSDTIRSRLVCKESAAALPVVRKEAELALTCRQQLKSLATMARSTDLLKIGTAILNRYTALKAERGVMDYDDLIATAKHLLETSNAAAWVLFKLDGGIDHILVDEAQDTSPDQWAIVKALADEFFAGAGRETQNRTIFAVGDKKQSIFSFQGAVPEEFERMRLFFEQKVEAAGKKWNNVPMYISFRSVQSVIDAVNLVLQSPVPRDGVVAPDENATHISFRKNQGGLVEVWELEKKKPDDTRQPFTKPVERTFSQTPTTRLAQKIARRIARMVRGGEILESQNRPIRAGDILVLVRRRNAFIEDLSRELKTLGVPVSGVDRLKITTHIAVRDLMVLGDFLLLPEDDLALATVLRSPLCGTSADDLSVADIAAAKRAGAPPIGVSERDLFDLAFDRGGQTLFDRLKAYENRPDTPQGKAYLFLKDLLGRVDKMRPFELYSYILDSKGGRAAFVSRLGEQALDALDEFMSLALKFDMTSPPSLQNFLIFLRRNDVEIKRDPEQSAFDAVRIMTVHASKGLQAPIVFLPDTHQTPTVKSRTFWTDDDDLPLWSPSSPTACERVKEEIAAEEQKQFREYNRLLYVALTRAADRLYVAGWESKGSPTADWHTSVQKALSGYAASVQTDESDSPVLRLTCEQTVPPALAQKSAEIRAPAPLPAWANRPAPAEPTPPRPLAPSRPDVDDPAAQSPLTIGRVAAVKRGILVHSLLEVLPRHSETDRFAVARKLIKTRAPGISDADADELIRSVVSLLTAPECAGVFLPDSLSEVPVSGVVNDRVVNGRIDRVAISENEVRLFDYKSGGRVPDGVDETPEAYILQMAAYRALTRQIYPDKTVRCFLLWTEAPKVVEITDLIAERERN